MKIINPLLVALSFCISASVYADDEIKVDQISLLRDVAIQRDLDLSNDQAYEVDQTFKELKKGQDSLVKDFRALPANLDQKSKIKEIEKLQKQTYELNKSFNEKLNKLLIPAQRQRLREISFQLRINRSALDPYSANGLLQPDISKLLGITPSQKERLRKLSLEKEKELQRKIEELRIKMRKELVSSLTEKQQKEYERLAGEPFERQ